MLFFIKQKSISLRKDFSIATNDSMSLLEKLQ